MAKPRIFVSSTYYDLKHIRDSLEDFIDGLGYEPILSEKGDIAFTPERPIDESCYREAGNADVLVLIIGGRYGSPTSETPEPPNDARERYESITKKEYETAVTHDIPVYISIEQSVYCEYQTYCQNRENDCIRYAQVESVNVFRLIDEILAQRRNNPVHQFRDYSDIEDWLREQWAGYFRELLTQKSNNEQLTSLATEVSRLNELNTTLQRYLEAVLTKIDPDRSAEVIEAERERLRETQQLETLKGNRLYQYLAEAHGYGLSAFRHLVERSPSQGTLADEFMHRRGDWDTALDLAAHEFLSADWRVGQDLDQARRALGLPGLLERADETQTTLGPGIDAPD